MDYVQPLGGAAGDPYVNGNPATGTPGSPVPAAAVEHPQREIVAAIEAAGLVPDSGDLTQLAAAIMALAGYDIPFIAGYSSAGVGKDLAVQRYGEVTLPRDIEILGEAASLGLAATDAALIVDVEKNGVSIYTTKPQFAAAATALTAGELTSDPDPLQCSAGDRLTFKVTQVGATVAGQELTFTLKGRAR